MNLTGPFVKHVFRSDEQQCLYIRAHPVVFWLCIGLVVEGFIGSFLPHLLLVSAVSQALPSYMERAFYAMYMVGASLAIAGQTQGKPSLESAGMSLLGTAFVVNFGAVLYLLHQYFWQGLFILTLAIGAYERSSFVAAYGYPVRKVGKRVIGRTDGGD